MQTTVNEIAAGIYRLSTYVSGITPDGFTFNQFLVDADEPLLFHCGMRGLFDSVSEAIARVRPLHALRWLALGHVEADECGALNHFLAMAPAAQALQGQVGCMVSINDLADRPPLALDDGARLDLGGRTVRLLATPHVPHGWEAIVLHEEVTNKLLCGDVLTTSGHGPALTEDDLADAVLRDERTFRAWSLAPDTSAQLHRLAALAPRTLAAMHGSSFTGDCAQLLRDLARGLERLTVERTAEGDVTPHEGPRESGIDASP